MHVRIVTLQPGINLPRIISILVSLLPQLRSQRLQHLHQKTVSPENLVPQHLKVSLELRYYHPATRRAMARGKAKVARDQDRLLPEIHRRPFVTSTSTRATVNMVINVNTVILNTIGTRGRTKVVKARIVDRLLREDCRLLVERRIDIAMDRHPRR